MRITAPDYTVLEGMTWCVELPMSRFGRDVLRGADERLFSDREIFADIVMVLPFREATVKKRQKRIASPSLASLLGLL